MKLQLDNKGDRGDMIMFKPDLVILLNMMEMSQNRISKYNSQGINESDNNYGTSQPIFMLKGNQEMLNHGNIYIHKTFSNDSEKIFEIIRDGANSHGVPTLSLFDP